MIVPILNGFVSIFRAPATWILFLANVLAFLFFLKPQLDTQARAKTYLDQDSFIVTQGQIFSQHVRRHPSTYSELNLRMARNVETGSLTDAMRFGNMAVRDRDFMENGLEEKFDGDQVAISAWRDKMRGLASVQDESPAFQFGLTHRQSGFRNWISYQFVHADFFHLAANMVFLLIFGMALEPVVGSFALLALFFSAGLVGALCFAGISGLVAVPLIGASGSISGIMGMFAAVYGKKPVKFFYWLLPNPKYFGFMYLPAWFALAMWSLLDLAGLLGTLEELGGTAHAAHLGGAAFGLIVGLVFFRRSKATAQSILGHHSGLNELK